MKIIKALFINVAAIVSLETGGGGITFARAVAAREEMEVSALQMC